MSGCEECRSRTDEHSAWCPYAPPPYEELGAEITRLLEENGKALEKIAETLDRLVTAITQKSTRG